VVRTLAVRLDSLGDVLVTGPAVRALAASSHRLTLLCGPRGAPAGRLLPGVDEVWTWECPWIDPEPGPVNRDEVLELAARVADGGFDRAVIFTSFHQSPLPTALLLRLAGVPWVGAISTDYPGSLLDLRMRLEEDLPEPERALRLARACGAELPAGDDGGLRVEIGSSVDIGATGSGTGPVVLHPGTSVPARAWPAEAWRETCRLLTEHGERVVVTGAAGEAALTAHVAGPDATDLGGRTSLTELARLQAGARAVVVANTGPAHLAAAVGAPVISLFAPTVPARRWAPYTDRRVVLGDQHAPCAGTRATTCPVPGHPCLSSVRPHDVVAALHQLVGPLAATA